jgi:hypothetical protein
MCGAELADCFKAPYFGPAVNSVVLGASCTVIGSSDQIRAPSEERLNRLGRARQILKTDVYALVAEQPQRRRQIDRNVIESSAPADRDANPRLMLPRGAASASAV